jgi:hypothetical protein
VVEKRLAAEHDVLTPCAWRVNDTDRPRTVAAYPASTAKAEYAKL